MNIYSKALIMSFAVVSAYCSQASAGVREARKTTLSLANDGFELYKKGDYKTAMKKCSCALALDTAGHILSDDLRGQLLFTIGNVYYQFWQDKKDIKDSDASEGCRCYGVNLKDAEKAIAYYQDALAISALPNESRAISLVNMGNIYGHNIYKDELPAAQALQCYQDAIALSALPHELHIATLLKIINIFENIKWDEQKTLETYLTMLALPWLNNELRAKTLIAIGDIHDTSRIDTNVPKNKQKALEYYYAVLALPGISNSRISKAYLAIGGILNSMEDGIKALECYQAVLRLEGVASKIYRSALSGLGHLWLKNTNNTKANWKKSFDYYKAAHMISGTPLKKARVDALSSMLALVAYYKSPQLGYADCDGVNEAMRKFAEKEMDLAEIEYAVNYILENFYISVF